MTNTSAFLSKLADIRLENGTVTNLAFIPAGKYTDPQNNPHPALPEFVCVQYHLAPTPDSFIRCELWLPAPENWNGRLWGSGNGGSAGGIPLGKHLDYLPDGDAIVTTDMGTSRGADGRPEIWKDFGYRATHLMTTSAKTLIEAFYGKPPVRSYFYGESTGGGQGLHEAQQYPDDYDGIVSGVPANCRIPLYAYFLHTHRQLRAADGGCLFTPAQYRIIADAAIACFAAKDESYASGRFLTNPEYSPEAAEAIIAVAAAKDPALRERELQDRLREVFAGPVIDGKRAFGGVPFGADIGSIANHNLWCLKWFLGQNIDPMKLDMQRDFDAFAAACGPLLNAENPDLNRFRRHGGKLLIFSGTEDCIVPYHAAMDYYERAAAHNGGIDSLREFCRYYLLPGRAHGGGRGVHFLKNLKQAMIDWRENGRVPEALPGVLADGEEIPVSPYPQKTAGDRRKGFSTVPGKRFSGEPINAFYLQTCVPENTDPAAQ